MFRESNEISDPGERDLRVHRVESVNGNVNALYEGVCRGGICEKMKRKERVCKEKEFTVGKELSKTGQRGKDSHEFGCNTEAIYIYI